MLLVLTSCKPAREASEDPDKAWIYRLDSPDEMIRNQALHELWSSNEESRIARLATIASPTVRNRLTALTGRIQLGLSPLDPPRLIELADRFDSLSLLERHESLRLVENLSAGRKPIFAAGAIQRSINQPQATAFWVTQADGAILAMENRVSQRAGRTGLSGSVLPMQLTIEAQEQLRMVLLDIANRIVDPSARVALLSAMRERNSQHKVYSIATLDFLWNQVATTSSPAPARAIQALVDVKAVSAAIAAAGTAPEAIETLANSLAYDEGTLKSALEAKPQRNTAVSILVALVRFPGWERNAGLTAAIRLDEAWKPRPASDAEVTSLDRDFAYHAAAAASGKDPVVALQFASRYQNPSAAASVGSGIRRRSAIDPPPNDAEDQRARLKLADISPEVKLEVLRQLSIAMGAYNDPELVAFLDISQAWFPEPVPDTMPTWHTITRGITKLRFDRDWPAAIKLFNLADQDPMAGRILSVEIHNKWPGWRKEAAAGGLRLPSLDVSLMSPDLFIAFLSGIAFQWENSPLNLKGYQLHLKGRETRWKLLVERSDLLQLVPMAKDADLAGDRESAWELLQIVASGQLPRNNTWQPDDMFATSFPLAAYLSHARTRSAIPSELQRLEALAAKDATAPPVILAAALELSRGDETAALARLEAERVRDPVAMPSTAERLEQLHDFVSQSHKFTGDPASWWSNWVEGFPKD